MMKLIKVTPINVKDKGNFSPRNSGNFDVAQARRDGNLARALIWLGKAGGESTFRWCTVSILVGPNEHGQYQVMRLADGWYGTTDRLMNLTPEQKKKILGA